MALTMALLLVICPVVETTLGHPSEPVRLLRGHLLELRYLLELRSVRLLRGHLLGLRYLLELRSVRLLRGHLLGLRYLLELRSVRLLRGHLGLQLVRSFQCHCLVSVSLQLMSGASLNFWLV